VRVQSVHFMCSGTWFIHSPPGVNQICLFSFGLYDTRHTALVEALMLLLLRHKHYFLLGCNPVQVGG
jgi:hypothetical protein